jgi:hypothetical protein
MEKQTDKIADSVKAMNEQTDFLRQSVEAARDSAMATSASVQMLVNEKRARVHIKIMPIAPIDLGEGRLPPPPGDSIEFKVFNHGPTAARIVNAAAVIEVRESEEKPQIIDGRADATPMTVDAFFLPTPDGIICRAHYRDRFNWDDIDNRRRFVHFSGFIHYKDLFSEDLRETEFRYVWRVWNPGFRRPDTGRPFAGWLPCGPAQDNRQT